MESIPLHKFLVEAGVGARRQAVSAVKLGRVTVNGKAATSYTMPVYPEFDEITCDGKPLKSHHQAKIVLMLNKPVGLLTTTSDDRGRRTVLDILPSQYGGQGIYPVGRLDQDTTGLLLLTNDGNLTYRLTHPKFELGKEYLVHVDGTLSPRQKEEIEKGLLLDDGMTSPATVSEITREPPFNYSIVIHEGRTRQVRRMFAYLGYLIRDLKRVRIGNLKLGDLKEGECRKLSPQEVGSLLKSRLE
ncbi:MAG: pseudouridine synthase [Dehalococcoidia bacterium]